MTEQIKICSNCHYWFPDYANCHNPDSEEFTLRKEFNDTCNCWNKEEDVI